MAPITGIRTCNLSVPMPDATEVIGPVAQIAKQKMTSWCWSAVITSIVASKQNPPVPTYTQQCSFAYAVLSALGEIAPSIDNCCGQDNSATCNIALDSDWIAGTYCNSPLAVAGISPQPPTKYNSQIIDDTLKSALRAGNPTCIVIEWESQDLHVIAIVGAAMIGGVQYYYVGDPEDGHGAWLTRPDIQLYKHCPTSQIGRWNAAYVTC